MWRWTKLQSSKRKYSFVCALSMGRGECIQIQFLLAKYRCHLFQWKTRERERFSAVEKRQRFWTQDFSINGTFTICGHLFQTTFLLADSLISAISLSRSFWSHHSNENEKHNKGERTQTHTKSNGKLDEFRNKATFEPFLSISFYCVHTND